MLFLARNAFIMPPPDDQRLAQNLSPPWPQPDEEVCAALAAAYADGSWGRYAGPHSERLMELLGELCGIEHVWLCSSGTIAVELALRAVKVGPGDEVILGGYDFTGNFRAVEAVGARPVLVDLVPGTWHLDVEQVAAATSSETKAVIASHLHGSIAPMVRLRELADDRGVAIVEDACQVPGAKVCGRPAGSRGDCGVLSFGGSKLLTSGRGGAVVSNRADVIQRIKIFSQRGNEAFPLSELQAAVLVPQIPKLAAANARRLENAGELLRLCGEIPGLTPLAFALDKGDSPVFYKLPWLMTGNSDACDAPDFEQLRGKLIAAIQAGGVAMDEGFRGFARRTSNRCRVVGDLTNARRAAAGTVLLHHPVLLESSETMARAAAAIQSAARAVLT
jgi:dTDP-4-amino-4,6-dideoxygalactose transaminase